VVLVVDGAVEVEEDGGVGGEVEGHSRECSGGR
jgi:hypothetical protein